MRTEDRDKSNPRTRARMAWRRFRESVASAYKRESIGFTSTRRWEDAFRELSESIAAREEARRCDPFSEPIRLSADGHGVVVGLDGVVWLVGVDRAAAGSDGAQ